ncbi:MAG: hypothetical protein L0170_11845 [Acidobacteria bacterium]|nr:hypothetical protein [Acidobacteriota bacterium]
MDPLNLLKELYGEEPIRKIMSSGFDSLSKIAAATPESLSFFAGIQEALARQIIESAEVGRPAASGKASHQELGPAASSPLPTQPRELSRSSTPRKAESGRSHAARREPLDERPLLDAGGVLKSLSKEPHPKELLNDDEFLAEVGLSNAEAGFLQGISPWSEKPPRERLSPVVFESEPVLDTTAAGSQELEIAPISSWSPDKDPNPVPRLVRAPELGPAPLVLDEVPAPWIEEPVPIQGSASKGLSPRVEPAPVKPGAKDSFWKFGR